ncbi:hypothetical protein [Chitinophaga polysaccharea]|uniref:hypothetical protein n=1 Tax=Chitinophaga polysaccharea TaxID=1293035 RepID=UPI00115B02FC|nr:hypothetical protein [Chitinophaga polysaccharea]
MKPTSLFRSVLLLSACILAGCHKDDNGPAPPPDKNCRIAVATSKTGATTITYTLSYDNDGRISKISMDDFYKTHYQFNYVQGQFTRDGYSDHWNGQLTSQLRAELNSMGLPTSIVEKRYDYTPSGQPPKLMSTATTTYEYNSKGELQLSTLKEEYIARPANNTTSTTTYTWANGNVVKQEIAGGSAATFEYYMDKPAQKGGAVSFDNLMNYGVNPINNKNLIKALTDGATIINVNYNYDETGKIKTTTLSGSTAAASQEVRYQYSCN